MGKKKVNRGGDEDPPPVTKSKRKDVVIDDDEYSFGTEDPVTQESSVQGNEEVQPPGDTGKKKGKKTVQSDSHAKGDAELTAKSNAAEEDLDVTVFTGKKKSKSKKTSQSIFTLSALDALPDEDANDKTEVDEQSTIEDPDIFVTGKKKSSKKTGGAVTAFNVPDEVKDEETEDQDSENEIHLFSGKKKSSKISQKGKSSGFLTLDVSYDEEEEMKETEDEPVTSFSGKKKSSKSSKKIPVSGFYTLDGNNDKVEEKQEDEDEPVVSLSGKKKSSKSSKKAPFTSFHTLGDEDKDEVGAKQMGEDDTSSSFSAKKSSQSSKKISGLHEDTVSSVQGDGEVQGEEDDQPFSFSGKKKSSKKDKKRNDGNNLLIVSSHTAHEEDDMVNDMEERPIKEVVESQKDNKDVGDALKKPKKSKKKSGRTAQEEEDVDKILAELGEGPRVSKPDTSAPPEEKVHHQPEADGKDVFAEEKEEEAEVAESAAAKKKKKKKEKEKEKKAAVAAAASASVSALEIKEEKPQEVKGKLPDKKIPKHVREMQEALARRKEAEERKKKEEEERLRKEEEERRRIEEAERLAEEAKKRKKEKEKEKLLKKKQEGRLLTGKQKEEARRREAMRNQFLASGGVLPSSDMVTKKPKYERKKSKLNTGQNNGGISVVEEMNETETQQDTLAKSEEPMEVEEHEEESVVEEAKEREEEMEENGTEEEQNDEDEWDAKSWDDERVVALPVKSPFAEEEEEEEKQTVKKVGTAKRVTEEEEEAEKPAMKKVGNGKRVTSPTSVNLVSFPETAKVVIDSKKVASLAPKRSHIVETKGQEPEVNASERQGKRKDGSKIPDSGLAETSLKKSPEDLRSPICCILGHVDTGKTKLLDCIRGTNVQEGEAGGITQQIGATYFPAENIRERTKELKEDAKLRVPGLLVIDTPGHESFTNLRSRGSGLCDIAILVVDIMHGLEQQTIESINLLKMRNTEFIVALNKVDRLYGWKTCPNAPIVKAMKQQSTDVQNEFKQRLRQIITQFMEQGLNTELYYKNKEMGQTFSIVPTSAVTGEGIPDLLLLLVQWTQKTMERKLRFSNEVECTVLEVKVVEGLGTTIDVVLVNGVLHEGDQIVVCGMQGPIVATIRALLTPHPMKELRVKGTYLHHKELKAAQGVKITAQGLEHAIAGTGLYVVGPDDDVEDIKIAAMQDMKSVMSRIDKSGEGVCVQASTLGSLEALLEFLKSPDVKIPVSGISIGPVHKKDVMRASVMLERKKEYATILAFDVKVTPEARDLAEETGVKIFCADIIYHLFDQFKAYIDNLKEEKKKEAAEEAVFPCVLKIMPNCIFNKKDPIVLGVDVLEGLAKVGTPLCIPSRDFITIGRIASMEINFKQVDIAKKGQRVAIKIVGATPEEQQKMYGRHFEIDDELVSHVSRRSIDVLKANYRDDLSLDEWKLVVKLKNLFKIQ